ncbi:hypothetical protein AAH979_39565 [Plantactinospora sp. ZYX-F-223]|uniref:hypothetical protein n=1 Tax=Plantactinospora sp. ZYX-F-223 TaxID=3144103 RepID=UPI0031FD0ABD
MSTPGGDTNDLSHRPARRVFARPAGLLEFLPDPPLMTDNYWIVPSDEFLCSEESANALRRA